MFALTALLALLTGIPLEYLKVVMTGVLLLELAYTPLEFARASFGDAFTA